MPLHLCARASASFSRFWLRALATGGLLGTLGLPACETNGRSTGGADGLDSGALTSPGSEEASGSDASPGAAPDDAGRELGEPPERNPNDASMEGGEATPVDAAHVADAAFDASELDASEPDASEPDASEPEVNDAAQASDAAQAGDTTVGADAAVPSIYDDDAKWLCRPGLPNSPCLETLEITDVNPDNSTTVWQLPQTPDDAAADCFYLYPTIDSGLLSEPRNLDFPDIDMDSVRELFYAQGLPFREACALWAPVYRQASLNSFEQEATREKGLETAYRDVEAAFDYYLQHAAPGRPIVFVVHSQGAILTTRLLRRRFEGHPELLDRLVVALLAGPLGSFTVPDGKQVGGTFTEIPLCTASEQTGCALTWNTFAASIPPNDQYGNINGGVAAGFDPGCTAPPGGLDGAAARLHGALFRSPGGLLALLGMRFNYGEARVKTVYARYVDYYTGTCVKSDAGLTYLRITAEPQPGDARVDPVPYDNITLNDPGVGLHALDYAFVSGDLRNAVKTKIAAYTK